MKQIKVLYNDLSVGFFVVDESQEIINHGFHVSDVNIINDILENHPVGTSIFSHDNYFRINK